MSSFLDPGAKKRRAIGTPARWPPVAELEVVGYITDSGGVDYVRDIGRSFELGNEAYYLFGDTFPKDRNGELAGIQSNTCAMAESSGRPFLSHYLDLDADGMVEPMLLRDAEEMKMMKDGECKRITLWPFGGVVQRYQHTGYMWYQKAIWYEGENHEYVGTGLAEITGTPQRIMRADRQPGMMFGPDEPRFGSFSCILHEPFFYLWGDHGDDILLGRVPVNYVFEREYYEFWTGEGWDNDWHKAKPVFREMQQGQIIRTKLFGEDKSWVFVGCNKWADNMIRIGVSENVEGPWDIVPVAEATTIDVKEGGFRYCMYPHPWALDITRLELMVTWSEGFPGGVIAGKLKFQEQRDQTKPKARLWKHGQWVTGREFIHKAEN